MDFSERQQEPGKKFFGIGLVVLFHIALVYALATGLATKVVKAIQKDVVTKIIEAPPPPPPPELPPPPPPKVLAAPPPPFIPPPEVQVQQQVQPPTITAKTDVRPPTTELQKTVQPKPDGDPKAVGSVVVPAVVDLAKCPPEYPRASLRNEETGTTLMLVTIGADGNVSDVKIEKSSGSRSLDNAVKNHLLSGVCKNKPGTIDGKPQPTTVRAQFVWTLN